VNNPEASLEIHNTKFIILKGRFIDKRSCIKVENIKGLLIIVFKGGYNAVKHQSIEICNGLTHGEKMKKENEQ
jgi:hypothetical protein